MSPRRSKRRSRGPEESVEKLADVGDRIAKTGKRVNRDPGLLAIVRSLRKVLPGDGAANDPLASGDGQPRAISKMMSDLSSERPGVLGEAGLGALQVWQSISEAQGRGRGKTELAIAFTDLVDFSDWALSAGDEAAIGLLRKVSEAIEPPVKANGGTIVKRLGDGMMAVFASPDHALKGISEGRDRLSKVKADGYDPRIRAGIHVGKPRKVGKDYFGVDVNIAARVADSAGPGELVVSGQALDELGAGVTTQKRELLDAKGVPEDFVVYAVTAA
jgi:class 3 adenylate cyclase